MGEAKWVCTFVYVWALARARRTQGWFEIATGSFSPKEGFSYLAETAHSLLACQVPGPCTGAHQANSRTGPRVCFLLSCALGQHGSNATCRSLNSATRECWKSEISKAAADVGQGTEQSCMALCNSLVKAIFFPLHPFLYTWYRPWTNFTSHFIGKSWSATNPGLLDIFASQNTKEMIDFYMVRRQLCSEL